jgi:uncharacterized protein (DUF305 family)
LVLTAGCQAQPAARPDAGDPNATDVMFLRMALEQIHEGGQVAALAGQRADNVQVKAVALDLSERWRDETGTMRRWLLGWQQPPTAAETAGAHAGHGDPHVLGPSDLDGLRSLRGEAFDRTAVSLLLSILHNAVETTRMESVGGGYPPAVHLADTMTGELQGGVRKLLVVAAKQ